MTECHHLRRDLVLRRRAAAAVADDRELDGGRDWGASASALTVFTSAERTSGTRSGSRVVAGTGTDHDQQAEEWGEQGRRICSGLQFTRPTSSAVSEG